MSSYLAAVSGILALLLVIGAAQAAPTISNVSVSPSSSLWVGESPTVSASCTDQNGTVASVHAAISGSDGYIIPNQTMSLQGGTYNVTVQSLYLTTPNTFTATIYCKNNQSQQTSQQTGFTLSNFSVGINGVKPGTVYIGNQVEIDVGAAKDGQAITSGVGFNVKLDGQPVMPVVTPPYDPAKGWVIYLSSPTTPGTKQVEVTGSFDRASATVSTSFITSNSVQFDISNIDKATVKPNDTVTIEVDALDQGSTVGLDTDNLKVKVGSTDATVTSITPVGNYYSVGFLAPDLDPQSYVVTATLSYKGSTYTDTRTVEYTVPIYGEIIDVNGGGVPFQVRFLQSGTEKTKIDSLTNGEYFGSVVPGGYDVEFKFPRAKMTLKGADIDEFDDPVKYIDASSFSVGGFAVAGLHVFEVSLPYDDVELEMDYDEGRVLNEGSLKLYKCSDWNTGQKACNSKWVEAGAEIDTIRNVAKVEASSLSAFLIGTVNELNLDFDLDAGEYPLGGLIRVKGVVLDKSTNTVSGAKVTASVKGTGVSKSAVSDSNGLFNMEFLAPDSEGTYSLEIVVEKNPFENHLSVTDLKVVKSNALTIVFPDTIRVSQGEEVTQIIKLVNSGQSDLTGLQISLSGIPEEYFILSPVADIGAGSEGSVEVKFSVPSDATVSTSSASIEASNDMVSKKKIFGFTVSEHKEDQSSAENSGSTPITGLFANVGALYSPQLLSSLGYFMVLAASAFGAAFFLKKSKRGGGVREVLSRLHYIKGYMVAGRRDPRLKDAKTDSDMWKKVHGLGLTSSQKTPGSSRTMWDENKSNKQGGTNNNSGRRESSKGRTYYSDGPVSGKKGSKKKSGDDNG